MGTIEWLLVWLIVNALFVVWRIWSRPRLKLTIDQSARRGRWATFGVGYGIKSRKKCQSPSDF